MQTSKNYGYWDLSLTQQWQIINLVRASNVDGKWKKLRQGKYTAFIDDATGKITKVVFS